METAPVPVAVAACLKLDSFSGPQCRVVIPILLLKVLKTLAAKLLSSHFNKEGYFDKMQDALRKV